MNRKVTLMILPLVVALSMFVVPALATIEHPELIAEGWALVWTPDELVAGSATLWVFTTMPDHGEEPVYVHLQVDEHDFWWIIDEDSMRTRGRIAMLRAFPAPDDSAPWPIRILACHRGHGLFAFGRGVFFIGEISY